MNRTDPLDETLKNMEGKQMPHLINGEYWWPESYLNAEIAKARIDELVHPWGGMKEWEVAKEAGLLNQYEIDRMARLQQFNPEGAK